ncbi:uncharacterized protein B0T15DRAFT_497038 [Chaetomium strumarium]|uniref:Uncharacterized protein n=1 Tax=Chaetomium strumarium TaxID=1170767 RepID=A0AAJ0GMB6_9PEZI|nr:hypothetical protein B0T15DRAFT_497038 [Chaetomium strumarium]
MDPHEAAEKMLHCRYTVDDCKAGKAFGEYAQTMLKYATRLAWLMIRLIPKEALGFASATPAQNRVVDWIAFMRLA